MANVPALPDEIFWLDAKVQSLLRPAAFLSKDAGAMCAQGGTRWWGLPDLPSDAPWTPAMAPQPCAFVRPWNWGQCPSDGESFWLQLNLEDIPAPVRKSEWPAVGVVWLFIDLSSPCKWRASTQFDPRPAATIPWLARLGDHLPASVQWTIADTLPECTRSTLPEIDWDNDLVARYTDWTAQHYGRALTNVQVGGWDDPCQGDYDSHNNTVVCSLHRQAFGDDGSVTLHYTVDRGFFAYAETH
jgi:hypothetical protein